MDLIGLAKTLAVVGVLLLVASATLVFVARWGGGSWPFLPGDIVLRGKGGTFVFPIVTCIVISVVLSLVLFVIRKFWN